MKQVTATIISHTHVGGDFREMALQATGLPQAQPGQFANLQVTPGVDPLLRRPLSIYYQDVKRERLHFLYQVVGRGTRLLSRRAVGDELSILAPLGRGFSLEGLNTDSLAILVGGGAGAAPLYFLAEILQQRKIPTLFFLGGPSRESLSFTDKMANLLGGDLVISTDDGSLGKPGFVTAALRDFFLRSPGKGPRHLFACGPDGMLKEVAALAKRTGVPLQVSLEAVMACGFGACLGCVCPVVDKDKKEVEYRRVCTEGPVFSSREVTL